MGKSNMGATTLFKRENQAVYERLEDDLPLPMQSVVSYEVDTAKDYDQAKKFVHNLI